MRKVRCGLLFHAAWGRNLLSGLLRYVSGLGWGFLSFSFSLLSLLNSASVAVLLLASFPLLSSLFCITVASFVNEFCCPGWEFALVVCLFGRSLVYKIVVFYFVFVFC